MKTPLLLCLIVASLAAGCSNNSSSNASAPQTNASAGATSPAPAQTPGTYMGAMNQAEQLASKTADLTPINEAVRMFQTEKGRYPQNLDELVQDKYLPRIPQPPTGMKYSYDPATGQVTLVQQ